MYPSIQQQMVAGVRTAFLDQGKGEPLVALHGIPTSSTLFCLLPPLLSGFRLIAPDLLGHGQTDTPQHGALNFAAYLRHLDAFLTAQAPATFSLLLHDFGGVLGLTWAAAHAERVRSVVLLSTTVFVSLRLVGVYGANLLGGARLLRHALPWTLQRPGTLDPQVLDLWAAPWTRRRLWRGMDHFSGARLRHMRRLLPGVPWRISLLWGKDDLVFPVRHAQRIAALCSEAELVTIPRCGHWSPLDAPEEVAYHVRHFCGKAGNTV